jgi:hypothetical protein
MPFAQQVLFLWSISNYDPILSSSDMEQNFWQIWHKFDITSWMKQAEFAKI